MKWIVLAGALVASACDSPVAPTAPPPPVKTVTVQLTGRVVDSDRQIPVQGALISLAQVRVPGMYRAPLAVEKASTITDHDGQFALTTNLQDDWGQVGVDFARDGFESNFIYFAEGETTAVIPVYPTLVIRPGESLETHVFRGRGSHTCGFEGILCRRVVVESVPGADTDLDIKSLDGHQEVGLVVGDFPHIFTTFERNVTVVGKEAWIVGIGRMLLTAHRTDR